MVLAAGGIGTPRILQASGFQQAGIGMTMDVTVMVYGFVKERGIGNEPPMTWSWENPEVGYMLSTLMDPWLLYPIINSLKGPQYALRWPRWNHILGVMIKLKDDVSGGVFPNGKISKPLTDNDRPRLKMAEEVCRKILIEAGARTRHDLHDPAARHASQRHGAQWGPCWTKTCKPSSRACMSAMPASSPKRSTGRPC